MRVYSPYQFDLERNPTQNELKERFILRTLFLKIISFLCSQRDHTAARETNRHNFERNLPNTKPDQRLYSSKNDLEDSPPLYKHVPNRISKIKMNKKMIYICIITPAQLANSRQLDTLLCKRTLSRNFLLQS